MYTKNNISNVRTFYTDDPPEYLYSGDGLKDIISYLLCRPDNIEDLLEELVVKAGWPTSEHPRGMKNPFFKNDGTWIK